MDYQALTFQFELKAFSLFIFRLLFSLYGLISQHRFDGRPCLLNGPIFFDHLIRKV